MMTRSTKGIPLLPTFHMAILPINLTTFRLAASQTLPISQEIAFEFFKSPENLKDITPPWLAFTMLKKNGYTEVRENTEIDYTITWLGIRMLWRSRIIDYHPPHSFTDIQVKGPYRSWVHVHTLKGVPEGTVMEDSVTYKLPFLALLVHGPIIKKNLEDIFCYRAVKIAEWAGEARQ